MIMYPALSLRLQKAADELWRACFCTTTVFRDPIPSTHNSSRCDIHCSNAESKSLRREHLYTYTDSRPWKLWLPCTNLSASEHAAQLRHRLVCASSVCLPHGRSAMNGASSITFTATGGGSVPTKKTTTSKDQSYAGDPLSSRVAHTLTACTRCRQVHWRLQLYG